MFGFFVKCERNYDEFWQFKNDVRFRTEWLSDPLEEIENLALAELQIRHGDFGMRINQLRLTWPTF